MDSSDEAERLAKAARARALLKKRQQTQKKKVNAPGESSAVGVSSPLSVISPSPPASVFSGAQSDAGDAPSEVGEIPPSSSIEKPSIDVVRKNSSASSPLSPPHRTNGSIADASSLFGSPNDSVTQAQLDNQQKTIELLVSEKASLSASLQKREDEAHRVDQEHAAALEETQGEIDRLTNRVSSLQDELRDSASARALLVSKEQEGVEKLYNMEREIEKLKRSLSDAQTRAKSHESRIRELEEEVQANDRVEALEKSLKGTQDRAESLEFQLSKSKQAHSQLKSDLEEARSKHAELEAAESEWKARLSTLNEDLSSLRQSLDTLTTTHDTLKQEHTTLTTSHSTSQNALKDSERLLGVAQSELSQAKAQIQRSEANASTAGRRADDAEAAQKKLQSDNVELMTSLNEMRPKVVELTQEKLNLTDESDRLQRSVRVLNETITQLETTLGEVRAELDSASQSNRGSESKWQAEKDELDRQVKELEQAYSTMEEELQNSKASVQELAMERTAHRKAVGQYELNLERLQASTTTQEAELAGLKTHLAETQNAEGELRELLTQTQTEVEALRAETSAKEEEILKLKDQIVIQSETPTPAPNGKSHQPGESIGGEMLGALQQQHALELSEARSQIRLLENSVYTEQSRAHGLQMQIAALESEITTLRTTAATARSSSPFRPPPIAGASSLRLNRTTSNQSITSNHSANGPARGALPPSRLGAVPPRVAINPLDEGLSADTRHKRKVSLSMLKARMESERGLFAPPNAASGAVSPSARSTGLAPLEEVSPSGTPPPQSRTSHELDNHYHDHSHHHDLDELHSMAVVPERSQFRDEAHIFWCHACSGDLVVL